MIRFFTMLHLAVALMLAAPVAMAEVSAERLGLTVGKSTIVEQTAAMDKVIVGNPEIIDFVLLSPTRFYLLGKALGTTNVQVLNAGGEIIRIIDVTVNIDTSEAERAIAGAIRGSRVTAHATNGRIRLSGQVPDRAAADRAVEIAQSYTVDPVINGLVVSDPKQVFLKVEIVEVSRTATQRLGVKLSSLELAGTNALSGTFTASVPGPDELGYGIGATVDALVNKGLARYLATPTLTALSGEEAEFLAGGEVPIPVSTDNNPKIEYKEFGVRLKFTPTVAENGQINIRLQPEVSQVDETNSFLSSGYKIPGFSTRKAATTVELRDGESFMIAGLLQSSALRDANHLPGLGNLPVIGPMFRQSELKDKETELLILVTPSLTRPSPRGVDIPTPADKVRPAGGAELFVDGRVERSNYRLRDALAGKGISGTYGPILNLGGQGAFGTK